MRNCSKSSKMVSLCLGLKIGLGHFLNIDIMTLVLGFELDWLVLKFIHMWKMWKVAGPCILLRLRLGYFLGVIWCPNSDMMMNLRIGIRKLDWLTSLLILMMKNVQSGIYLYWIGSFLLCCFLDWLIFLLKNVQSGKSMYLIWNWIGLFLDDMIWWWTYVLGFGIGLANISAHIYD